MKGILIMMHQFTVKAVIFDLDGTLVNSHEAYAKAYKEVLTKHGVIIRKEQVVRLFGMTAEDIIKRLLPELSAKEIRDIVREKSAIFDKSLDLIKPLPCAENLLRKLGRCRLALATSSSRKSTDLLLRKFGWDSFFNVVLTGYDVPRPKPAPDILIEAAKLLELSVKDCLFVGDSIFDARAATAAGMKFIGVETGSFKKKDFKAEGFFSYPNLCELSKILFRCSSRSLIIIRGIDENMIMTPMAERK